MRARENVLSKGGKHSDFRQRGERIKTRKPPVPVRLEEVSPQDGSQESGKPAADRVIYGHSHSSAQRGHPCFHLCNARRVKRPESDGVKKLRQRDDEKGGGKDEHSQPEAYRGKRYDK